MYISYIFIVYFLYTSYTFNVYVSYVFLIYFSKLTSNFASFMKSVRLFDYNRDGHVQKNELKRILDSCGVKLQENQYTK